MDVGNTSYIMTQQIYSQFHNLTICRSTESSVLIQEENNLSPFSLRILQCTCQNDNNAWKESE